MFVICTNLLYLPFKYNFPILEFKYLGWEKNWNPNLKLRIRIPDNLWKTGGSRIRIVIPGSYTVVVVPITQLQFDSNRYWKPWHHPNLSIESLLICMINNRGIHYLCEINVRQTFQCEVRYFRLCSFNLLTLYLWESFQLIEILWRT